MGRAGKFFGATVAAVLWLLPCASHAKTDYHSGVWNLLRAAHFPFADNGDSRAWLAGSILAGGRQYEIWGYAWEETPQTKTASTEHASYHLLIFERKGQELSFIGDYSTDGTPFRVTGRTIKFDYGGKSVGRGPPLSNRDDEIVFDKGPPELIFLGGAFHQLDPAAHHMGIWRVMEKGRFRDDTGVDAHISLVGPISAGGKQYEIWSYAWEENKSLWNEYRPGHRHESYKILVFERTSKGLFYLGSYERDNVGFRVEGRTIKFDLPKSGRPSGYLRDDPGEGIVFDDKGPPAQARINWVTRPFVK